MKLFWNDRDFILNEKASSALFEEGMEYFCTDVLPLYEDEIIADPEKGIEMAFSDFLSNDSPVNDGKEFLSWGEVLAMLRALRSN